MTYYQGTRIFLEPPEVVEELEDVSLDLSAYYQSLEDFGTWLRAHDGLEFEDLVSQLEAAGWTTEDLSTYITAWYQSLEDAGLSLEMWASVERIFHSVCRYTEGFFRTCPHP